jgi:ParB-like chromosome segregation protein Spo0J
MAHAPYFSNAGVTTLDVTAIDPDHDGRIGLFFPAKAEALAALIDVHGQNDPIKVVARGNAAKTPWKLVAGLHRLEACRLLGRPVTAIEILGDADAQQCIQASENMDRRELEPLERALFVSAVAEAAQRRLKVEHGDLSQQALAGMSRQNKVQFSDAEKADEDAETARLNLARAYGWRDETAEACGLSLTSLKRSMRIFRCIVSENRDLMDAFKNHPVAQTTDALLKIAALKDAGQRRQVIETLIAGPADLGMVLQMLGIKPPAAETDAISKFSAQIIGAASRLGTADWRDACPGIAKGMTQAKRITLRAALDEAIRLGGEA